MYDILRKKPEETDFMKYYFFVPLGTFLFHFFIFTYVLALDKKKPVNRAYLFFTGIMALWVLGCIIYYIPLPENTILPSMRLLSLAWSFTGIAFINFIFVYLKIERNTIFILILAGAFLSAGLTLFHDNVISGYQIFPWGQWIVTGKLYNPIIMISFTLPALYGALLLFLHRRKEQNHVRYRQHTIIISGILLNFIAGIIMEFLLPALDATKDMVRLTSSSTIILTGTFFYIIVRYRFLVPDIKNTAETIFASAQDGMVILSARGKVLHANPSAQSILNLKPEQQNKVYLRNIIPGYDHGKNYHNHEIQFEMGEEKRILLLSQSTIYYSEKQKGIILIIRDITEERLIDRRLKKSEERFRSLVENISEIIFEISPDSTITYVSPAVTAATGHPARDLKGHSFYNFIHPEDREKVGKNFQNYPEGKSLPLEFRILCADGSYRHFMSGQSAVIDHDGGVGYRGVLTNIETLVKTRQKLQQTEELYRRIIYNVSDVIWIMNIDAVQMTYVSPSVTPFSGWTPEEYKAIPIKDHFTEESFQFIINSMTEELKRDHERHPDRSRSIEYTEIDKNGNIHIMEALVSFLRDNEGKPVDVLGVTRDITERKNLEGELKESLKTLKERNDIIESDLKTAQLIQQALLPESGPQTGYLKSSYRYLPLEAVGGDYFNFIEMREGGVGVFIADVVGHGIPAALFLSLLKSSTNKIWRKYALKPREFMSRLNHDLVEVMSSYFITALYGYFSEEEKGHTSFTFSNGGHPPPIIYRHRSGAYEAVHLRGPLVGAFDDRIFHETTIHLEKGDRLFIYTDGLPETVNREKEIIGFDTLPAFFQKNHGDTLDATLNAVLSSTEEFRDPDEEQDDLVLIGVEIK